MLTMKNLSIRSSASLLLALLPLASCGGSDAVPAGYTEAAGSATDQVAGMPPTFWSDAPLADPLEVRDARESAKDGDEVVLRGTLQDFGELSTFSLVDDALDDCTEMGEKDHCKEPWDYCCADPDELARLTVNVEYLEDGLPGDWSFQGQRGLDRLTEVLVAGVLRKDEAGNMRLEAQRMSLQ